MSAIVLAAGGTGGHLFPAKALAAELTARGHKVHLLTDPRGENIAREFENVDVHILKAASPSKKNPVKILKALYALWHGNRTARSFLKEIKPAAVVGFGGYASAPTLWAARSLKIPFILHEQNTVLGRVNRLFAKNASLIALSFPNTKRLMTNDKAVVTGNPVRSEFLSVRELPFKLPAANAPITLLVIGGSLGARIFSEIIPAACALLPVTLRHRLEIIQQCRSQELEETRLRYREAGMNAVLAPFFNDIPQRLATAHLVIARSGSSVTEIMVAGRPSILVPLPIAADDHQTDNAKYLADNGAAWLIPQPQLTAPALAEKLEEILIQQTALSDAAAKARDLGMVNAVPMLADYVEKISSL